MPEKYSKSKVYEVVPRFPSIVKHTRKSGKIMHRPRSLKNRHTKIPKKLPFKEKQETILAITDKNDETSVNSPCSYSASPSLHFEISRSTKSEKSENVKLPMPNGRSTILQSTPDKCGRETAESNSPQKNGLSLVQPYVVNLKQKSDEMSSIESKSETDICFSISKPLPHNDTVFKMSSSSMVSSNFSGDTTGPNTPSCPSSLKCVGDFYDKQSMRTQYQMKKPPVPQIQEKLLQLRSKTKENSILGIKSVKEKQFIESIDCQSHRTSKTLDFLTLEEALLRARHRVKQHYIARSQDIRMRRQLRQQLVEERRRELSEAEQIRAMEISERHIMHPCANDSTRRKHHSLYTTSPLQPNLNRYSAAAISRLAFINAHPTGFGSKLPRFTCLTSQKAKEFMIENSNSTSKTNEDSTSMTEVSVYPDLGPETPPPSLCHDLHGISMLREHFTTQSKELKKISDESADTNRHLNQCSKFDYRTHFINEQSNTNNYQGSRFLGQIDHLMSSKRTRSMIKKSSEWQLDDGFQSCVTNLTDGARKQRKSRDRRSSVMRSTRTKSRKSAASTSNKFKTNPKSYTSTRSPIRKQNSRATFSKTLKRVPTSRLYRHRKLSAPEMISVTAPNTPTIRTQHTEIVVPIDEDKSKIIVSVNSDDSNTENTQLRPMSILDKHLDVLNYDFAIENASESPDNNEKQKHINEYAHPNNLTGDLDSSVYNVDEEDKHLICLGPNDLEQKKSEKCDDFASEMVLENSKSQIPMSSSPRKYSSSSAFYNEQREARKQRLECIMSRVKSKQYGDTLHKPTTQNHPNHSLTNIGDGCDNDANIKLNNIQKESYSDYSTSGNLLTREQDSYGLSVLEKTKSTFDQESRASKLTVPSGLNQGKISPIRATVVAHMLASGLLDANSRAAAILLNRVWDDMPVLNENMDNQREKSNQMDL